MNDLPVFTPPLGAAVISVLVCWVIGKLLKTKSADASALSQAEAKETVVYSRPMICWLIAFAAAAFGTFVSLMIGLLWGLRGFTVESREDAFSLLFFLIYPVVCALLLSGRRKMFQWHWGVQVLIACVIASPICVLLVMTIADLIQ